MRARQFLKADQNLRRDLLQQQVGTLERLRAERRAEADWLSRYAKISPHGFVETSLVPSPELLLHLLNAVSGRGGPIDVAKRKRLSKAMDESGFSATTLAGAWVVPTSHGFLFTRDQGMIKGRRNLKPNSSQHSMTLSAGQTCLWDGRFYVRAKDHDLTIYPAQGHLGKLVDLAETKAIFDCPAEVRGTLPVYSFAQKVLGFGGINSQKVTAEPVSAQRLQSLV